MVSASASLTASVKRVDKTVVAQPVAHAAARTCAKTVRVSAYPNAVVNNAVLTDVVALVEAAVARIPVLVGNVNVYQHVLERSVETMAAAEPAENAYPLKNVWEARANPWVVTRARHQGRTGPPLATLSPTWFCRIAMVICMDYMTFAVRRLRSFSATSSGEVAATTSPVR